MDDFSTKERTRKIGRKENWDKISCELYLELIFKMQSESFNADNIFLNRKG